MSGDELSAAYASGDVFMMPSESETLGFVALEAMASGLPVVAVAAGGLTDILTNPGVTGLPSYTTQDLPLFCQNAVQDIPAFPSRGLFCDLLRKHQSQVVSSAMLCSKCHWHGLNLPPAVMACS